MKLLAQYTAPFTGGGTGFFACYAFRPVLAFHRAGLSNVFRRVTVCRQQHRRFGKMRKPPIHAEPTESDFYSLSVVVNQAENRCLTKRPSLDQRVNDAAGPNIVGS